MKGITIGFAASIFAMPFVCSCGGGSGGSNGGGSSGATGGTGSVSQLTAPAAYIGYTTSPSAAFMLAPVSSLPNPGSQVLATASPYTQFIDELTVDSSGAPSAWDHGGLIHFNATSATSGQWQSIDFRSGSLQPSQVSSTTPIPCGFGFTVDNMPPMIILRQLTDSRTAIIVYQSAGPDGQCGTSDDVVEAINFDSSPNDAPVPIPGGQFPSGILYSTAGKLAGLTLVANQQLLFVTDFATFQGGQVLSNNVIDAHQLGHSSNAEISSVFGDSGQMFLQVADTSYTSTLRRVDTLGAYSGSLYEFKSNGLFNPNATTNTFSTGNPGVEDGSNLYVLEGYEIENIVSNILNDAQYYINVISVPLDGSQAASTIHQYTGYESFETYGQTTHNIIVELIAVRGDTTGATSTAVISKTADNTTTTPNTIAAAPAFVTDTKLYFNNSFAYVTDESGSTVTSQYNSGFFFGTLRMPTSMSSQTPNVKDGHILLAYSPTGTSAMTFYDLAGDQAPVAFTAPDGSSALFSPAYPTNSGISFESQVPADAGEILVQANSTQVMDILGIDFNRHFAEQVVNTAAATEFAYN